MKNWGRSRLDSEHPASGGSPLALLAVLLVALLAAGGCARTDSPPGANEPQGKPPTSPPSASTTTPVAAEGWPTIQLTPLWSDLDQPLLVTHADDGTDRLFIVEKQGRIRVVLNDTLLEQPLIDIRDKVSKDGERGLLGLAFPPNFARSGRFYVNYTDKNGTTVISRFRVSPATGNVSNPRSEQVLLQIQQPYANHNGGCLAFDTSGFLIVGTGDGGSAGDPHNNAQDITSLLGKLLRIDVGESTRSPAGLASRPSYSIPADNPRPRATSERGSWRPEIWALGLRNPWRFSFDRATDDLWIGDVGQNAREEIDVVPGPDPLGLGRGALNFGWNEYEGSRRYPPGSPPTVDGGPFTAPVIDYPHSMGQSVTGGYVYRGDDYPALKGLYLYGDFVSGRVWGLRWERTRTGGVKPVERRELLDSGLAISSFGEDETGELYVCDLGGTVYRIDAR